MQIPPNGSDSSTATLPSGFLLPCFPAWVWGTSFLVVPISSTGFKTEYNWLKADFNCKTGQHATTHLCEVWQEVSSTAMQERYHVYRSCLPKTQSRIQHPYRPVARPGIGGGIGDGLTYLPLVDLAQRLGSV